MLVALLIWSLPAAQCDVPLPELEYLVGQLSFTECQHLADALKLDLGATNVEGVSCLDELIRLHYALKNEGPNIARGVFKHKLNQIGRPDLAQWMSIEKDLEVFSRSKNGAEERIPIEGKNGPPETSSGSSTSWCEIAVTIALLYTGALLVWLTIRVVLCKMKKHFRDKGNNGYSYHMTHQPQLGPHRSTPCQQRPPPNQHRAPLHQQWPVEQASPYEHHHYHPPPTATTSQPAMTQQLWENKF